VPKDSQDTSLTTGTYLIKKVKLLILLAKNVLFCQNLINTFVFDYNTFYFSFPIHKYTKQSSYSVNYSNPRCFFSSYLLICSLLFNTHCFIVNSFFYIFRYLFLYQFDLPLHSLTISEKFVYSLSGQASRAFITSLRALSFLASCKSCVLVAGNFTSRKACTTF